MRLWLLDLDHVGLHPQGLLAADEVARMQRFHFPHDARRYGAAHAGLRSLLARELGTEPQRLDFAAGAQGKPSLTAHPGVHFNLSHSGRWGLVGRHDEAALGVDIEELRPHGDHVALAMAYYTARERRALQELSGEASLAAFLRCWTRKEAALKAVGSGLMVEPHTFDTGEEPGDAVTEIDYEGRRHRVALQPLELPVGAVAAAAWLLPA